MSEKILKLHRKALYVARRWGYYEHAEDFAQEVAAGTYVKPGQTVEQGFIDFIRKEFGATRPDRVNRHQGVKRSIRSAYVPIEKAKSIHYLPTDGESFTRLLDHLKGTHRTVVCLGFKWGLTDKEIGECLDLTAARVSQIRIEALMKLKQEVERPTRRK